MTTLRTSVFAALVLSAGLFATALGCSADSSTDDPQLGSSVSSVVACTEACFEEKGSCDGCPAPGQSSGPLSEPVVVEDGDEVITCTKGCFLEDGCIGSCGLRQ